MSWNKPLRYLTLPLVVAAFALSCGDKDPGETGDDSGAAGGGCEAFCDAVENACPEDTECLSSCETLASSTPSASDVECAEAATDCTATNACFNNFF